MVAARMLPPLSPPVLVVVNPGFLQGREATLGLVTSPLLFPILFRYSLP